MSRIISQSKGYAPAMLGRRIGLVALAGLALAGLPLLRRALMRLVALLGFPYPHDGLEGTLLHEARLLWSGQPLYQPIEPLRFVSAPYPPLHPLLLALADTLGGPHVFWSGRLISLICALGVAALILLICRRAGGTWLGGAIGASLFLSAPPVLLWATRIKPDMLALLLTGVGLYLAAQTLNAERRTLNEATASSFIVHRSAFIAATCFVLAFFTKQTAVAAPLATGLALLIGDVRAFPGFGARLGERARARYIGRLPVRWRTFAFGMAYAALALATWLLLDAATGGLYTAHVWGLHRSEWWSADLLRKFVALLGPYWPAMLLAAAIAVRAILSGRALVPACYALVAPISMLGAGETGANHNHLLESLLALALIVGCAAGWMVGSHHPPTRSPVATEEGEKVRFARTPRVVAVLIFALLAGQIALAYRPQEWYGRELEPPGTPERYLAFIRATPGEILADDVGLLFAAGRPLRYDDPSTMGPAARSGVWDQRGLLREIAERKFSAILLPVNVEEESGDASGRWTVEMLDAVRAHYRLAFRDTIFTYIPK